MALGVAVLAAGLGPAIATSPHYPDSGMSTANALVSVGATPTGGSDRADSPAVSDSGRFIAYTQRRQENYYYPATSEVWRRDIVWLRVGRRASAAWMQRPHRASRVTADWWPTSEVRAARTTCSPRISVVLESRSVIE